MHVKLTIDEAKEIFPPKTKTQKGNEKKLARLQEEARLAGRPIPEKIPPTERQKRRARRAAFEKSRLVPYQKPKTVKAEIKA